MAAVERIGVGRGAVRPPGGSPQLENDVRAALGPRRHRTLSLHDHIEIGLDALPARTRTMQVIEAIEPGTDRIPYLYDTNALTLETGQGCQGYPASSTRSARSCSRRSILLSKVLNVGETSTLEYWTTYQFRGRAARRPARQHRRAVMAFVENVDMRVQSPSRELPAGLWWATWDGVDGDVIEQEQVGLDLAALGPPLPALDRATVVGFHWSGSSRPRWAGTGAARRGRKIQVTPRPERC